ncbi:hypothetical protein FBQ83_05080 [Chloroflexi bacterium CFX5]|nr:hypothetical protein [Anaerolineales bacterium]MCQ3954191.1 hypothetical protein [Chloroflexota bacterium]MDL1918680.1 hypothetical protein [Chloroflexi bacterium CFX5]NUQ60523.1 hypothetical protein [Anaerolineales bacterium]
MSSRYTSSKWLGILIVVTIVLSLIVSSRPAAAQEEIPPTATETPSDDGFIPTIMPTPTVAELFPPIQPQDMEEQPQFTQRMNAPLGTN